MQHLLHSSIPADFLDYLAQFGYRFNKISRFVGDFTRETCRINFNHLSITVQHFEQAIPLEFTSAELKRTHTFTDIDKLDFLGWVMLLDLTGAVAVKELLGAFSRKELSSIIHTVATRLHYPGLPVSVPTLALQEEETVQVF